MNSISSGSVKLAKICQKLAAALKSDLILILKVYLLNKSQDIGNRQDIGARYWEFCDTID